MASCAFRDCCGFLRINASRNLAFMRKKYSKGLFGFPPKEWTRQEFPFRGNPGVKINHSSVQLDFKLHALSEPESTRDEGVIKLRGNWS